MATERRIILIGKTGNGKSSTGNTLLGVEAAFETGFGLTAVTQKCQSELFHDIIVCDTPGLMDTDLPFGKRLLEIHRSVEICPEPHAFLLIFSSDNRITKDEEYTIDALRVAFGEKMFDHCIVVFTKGRKLRSDQKFETFWKQSPMIVKLVKKCAGRIIRKENEDHGQRKAILDLIEIMSDRGNKKYQYPYIQTHKVVLQKHIANYDGNVDYRHQLSALTYSLGIVLGQDVWKVMLVGGTIVAISALGGAGVAYLGGSAAVAMASSGTLRATVVSGASALGAAALALGSKFKFW